MVTLDLYKAALYSCKYHHSIIKIYPFWKIHSTEEESRWQAADRRRQRWRGKTLAPVCGFILACKARERETVWKWKLNWHRFRLATNQRAQTIQKLPNIDGRVWKSNDGVICRFEDLHTRHNEIEGENDGEVGVSVIFSMLSPQESRGEWIANGDDESHEREEKVTVSVVNERVSVGMHYKLYKTTWHVFHVVV